jgi:hypothetical protein
MDYHKVKLSDLKEFGSVLWCTPLSGAQKDALVK